MRTVASSLPCVPPAYTVSFTRPAVLASHSAPMSSSTLCHEELTGACVAILTVMAAQSDDDVTSAKASMSAILRTDIQPPTLLRKLLVDAIEQHAGASLSD